MREDNIQRREDFYLAEEKKGEKKEKEKGERRVSESFYGYF